jgi:hypothetical protein
VREPQTLRLGRRRCIGSSDIRETTATWAIAWRAPSALGSEDSRENPSRIQIQRIAEDEWQIEAHYPGAELRHVKGFKSKAEIDEWLQGSGPRCLAEVAGLREMRQAHSPSTHDLGPQDRGRSRSVSRSVTLTPRGSRSMTRRWDPAFRNAQRDSGLRPLPGKVRHRHPPLARLAPTGHSRSSTRRRSPLRSPDAPR